MTMRRTVVVVSFVVGVATGLVGMTLVRAQSGSGQLDLDVDCELVSPQRMFLGPTAVRVNLSVSFASALDADHASDVAPELDATLILPSRWTAYARSSRGRELTDTTGNAVLRTFQLPIAPALTSYTSVRRGRTRLSLDVLGPTDAAPDSFSVEVVMRDVDGRRIARTIDDPCPLPAGPLHEPSGAG